MADLPDFLVIPSELLNIPSLTPLDGYVFGVIYWFSRQKLEICSLSNKEIAELVMAEPRSIQRSLARLAEEEYIKIDYDKEGNRLGIISLLGMGKWTRVPDDLSPYAPHDPRVTPPRPVSHQNNNIYIKKSLTNVSDKESNALEEESSKGTPPKPWSSPEWLMNVPLEDMEFLTRNTSASHIQVRQKGEDLYLWLKTNRKRKYDHRAFLRNALLKDYRLDTSRYGATKNAKDYRGF